MVSDNKTSDASWLDHCKAFPQRLLPHHLLSRGMHALARSPNRVIRNALIGFFLSRFGIDLSQAEIQDPRAYPSFNDFFTRALRPGARPLCDDPDAMVSPVDATVSQYGPLESTALVQAKGKTYDAVTLLGGDEARAAPFQDGQFLTLYLSPRDYHRIHMPLSGRLREMVYVPGRLFSVSPATTRALPRLFTRNERVALIFDTDFGPLGMVLVGALFVGSIETVWAGEITPPPGRRIRSWRYEGSEDAVTFAKGDEVGRFNMGSTVILLTPPGKVTWDRAVRPEQWLAMGQRIASLAAR
ncbi:MAG: archaetidylserine decarboxylase [Gammaproteobacteria bacterium]